jgi:hypothetical protein
VQLHLFDDVLVFCSFKHDAFTHSFITTVPEDPWRGRILSAHGLKFRMQFWDPPGALALRIVSFAASDQIVT